MESRLTAGAVERILNNQQVDKPVLQVLNFKPISSNTADRYRLLLSDGVQCHTYAMLGTQLNGMINNNEIDKFAVVQLDKYMCNVVSPDKKVLIVLDLTVIAKGSTVGCRLGNPVIPTSSSTGAAQPADGGANKPTFQPNGGHVPPSAAPSFGNRASYPASTSDVVVVPIASLTPYQNRWTIRVRVTNKSNIRTWSNSKGEGKLFSMDLLDESGEIRATAFNAECDRLYDVVEVNKVYYISRAIIKNVRKGYSYSSIKNDFEMSFIPETTITPCDDVTPNIPTLQFNFVPISRLQEIGKDSVIDVIGVCKSAGDLQTVTRRTTNQELKKRDVNLVDRSGTEVSLTLWGDQAEKFDGSDNPVVAVKGVRVSDFSGVSLSLISSSMLQVNPDIPESHALIGWYSREGTLLQTRSLSTRSGGPMGGNTNWKSIAQAKAEGLGQGDKPDYYSVKACVSIIRKENCLYKACPSENCNKKVVDLQNGYYRCEKCAQETMDFKWRLLVSANLTDFSDGQWVTCFGKEAEMLIGASAEDLGEMYSMSSKEDSRYEDILNEVPFKPFIFRLRTKMEVYNDESRLKTSVMSVAPVNYVEYTQKLLKDIAELNKSL